jgi:hypothetical protein
MFKELFKKWFGTTETKSNNKQRIKIQKFESVEEARGYIYSIKSNKTHKQIAKYLNRKGYRTVRGCEFSAQTVKYYMKDDLKLRKIRAINSNYYWNKKKNSQGVTA